MTPEQNELWKQAITSLDYLDSHALSDEGLAESLQRLEEWGVPHWVAELRAELITWRYVYSSEPLRAYEPRTLEFALRSETALVGIQISHVAIRDREAVYPRVLVRFVREALTPFFEYAGQLDTVRRKGYEPLLELYRLCGILSPELGLAAWPEPEVLFPQTRPTEPNAGGEAFSAQNAGRSLLRLLRDFLVPTTCLREASSRGVLDDNIYVLNRLHEWRLVGEADPTFPDNMNHTYLIATAFLTALEAECPPQNSLP